MAPGHRDDLERDEGRTGRRFIRVREPNSVTLGGWVRDGMGVAPVDPFAPAVMRTLTRQLGNF
jgi:hypothetical protein